MWFHLNIETFQVKQSGFLHHKSADFDLYFVARNNHLKNINELSSAEYAQAIQVNPHQKTVSFGRDYLGQHPLLYAFINQDLFISDDLHTIIAFLRKLGHKLTLSEEALALYFSLGYVPQGMTLFNEIIFCENASLYHWRKGKIHREDLFTPVQVDADFPLPELAYRIENSISQFSQGFESVDVWCSGGLDSSIMAICCHKQNILRRLLTISYQDDVQKTYGQGELPYAYEVANFCQTPLKEVVLDKEIYREVFSHMLSTFQCPVIDICVPPKFALAKNTHALAITGEGGDPLFAGDKNNFTLFMRENSDLPLGWIYALAHRRQAKKLNSILKSGEHLQSYVSEYLEGILDRYPGTLTRKLLYANTFLKQGSLIFPENYYPSTLYNIKLHHPLTARAVYEAAFSLLDEKKYCFPQGKIALMELYSGKLPEKIVKRSKSGMKLPLETYIHYLTHDQYNFECLKETNLFQDKLFDEIEQHSLDEPERLLLKYSLIMLNNWLKQAQYSTFNDYQ